MRSILTASRPCPLYGDSNGARSSGTARGAERASPRLRAASFKRFVFATAGFLANPDARGVRVARGLRLIFSPKFLVHRRLVFVDEIGALHLPRFAVGVQVQVGSRRAIGLLCGLPERSGNKDVPDAVGFSSADDFQFQARLTREHIISSAHGKRRPCL